MTTGAWEGIAAQKYENRSTPRQNTHALALSRNCRSMSPAARLPPHMCAFRNPSHMLTHASIRMRRMRTFASTHPACALARACRPCSSSSYHEHVAKSRIHVAYLCTCAFAHLQLHVVVHSLALFAPPTRVFTQTRTRSRALEHFRAIACARAHKRLHRTKAHTHDTTRICTRPSALARVTCTCTQAFIHPTYMHTSSRTKTPCLRMHTHSLSSLPPAST